MWRKEKEMEISGTVASWSDFDDDSTMPCTRPLMAKLAEKLEWGALRQTVSQLDWGVNLPEQFEEAMLEDE